VQCDERSIAAAAPASFYSWRIKFDTSLMQTKQNYGTPEDTTITPFVSVLPTGLISHIRMPECLVAIWPGIVKRLKVLLTNSVKYPASISTSLRRKLRSITNKSQPSDEPTESSGVARAFDRFGTTTKHGFDADELGDMDKRARVEFYQLELRIGASANQQQRFHSFGDALMMETKPAGESKFSGRSSDPVPQEQPRLSPQFRHL
jgi:hypothetical protein